METSGKKADVKLSVVIPCYNAAETISDQLETLAAQQWDYPWEVIVADNGSSDDSVEIVRNYKDTIRNLTILDASEKKGPCYARNKGVENANGEYIAFTDADDIVGEDWLKNIGNALLTHNFVASRMDWAKLNNFSEHTLRSKVQTDKLIDFSMVNFLQHGGGSTLGIKKSIHNEVDGFDEAFKYCGEIDYCWKIQLEGYNLTFIPEAVIQVRARNSDFKKFKQEFRWGKYDVLIYEKYKHLGMPGYSLKQSLRSLYYVLRGWKNFFSSGKKALWIIKLGQRFGRLEGMIKYRYLHLSQ